MRYLNPKLLVAIIAMATYCVAVRAQGPTYHLGKSAIPDEVKAYGLSIGPDGTDLPPGSGTAKQGAAIFAQKCATCHGPTASEATFLHGRLVGGKGSLTTLEPVKTIGSYWPYAPIVWDYINRAMPRYAEGSLKPDEVYSLTAFLLYRNGIVQETDVIDAKTLPRVQMPNRNGFYPAEPSWKPGYYQPYFSPQPIPRTKKQ